MGMNDFFWVEFDNRASGTIEANNEFAALQLANNFGKPRRARVIPYPADPRIVVDSDCPSFCHSPRKCVGRTSCPMRRACSE